MLKSIRDLVRRGLTRTRVAEASPGRRVRVSEEAPTDRFVLIIVLMVIFFVGLVGLELVHMLLLGSWNDIVFNGIMLIVGTIVGAVWGRTH